MKKLLLILLLAGALQACDKHETEDLELRVNPDSLQQIDDHKHRDLIVPVPDNLDF